MPDTMLEKGTEVTTHPLWFKGHPRVPSKRGVVVKPHFVPGMSRVQIGGEVLTFWNFELEEIKS